VVVATILSTIIAVKKSKKFKMLFGPSASIVLAFNNVAVAQVNPIIADTSDYEFWKTGKSIPGMISTTFSFIDKMVSSALGFIVGSVIGLFAYQIGDEVTTELYWAVMGMYMMIPLVVHIISILAKSGYELDCKMNIRIANEIRENK
jgi:Na+/melibiose symporter-like transporter